MEYKISLNAMLSADNELFTNLNLPIVKTAQELGIPQDQMIPEAMRDALSFTANNGINRNALIYKLCMDTINFSVIFPDPAVLKQAIGMWSLTRLPSWQMLYDTLFHAYNPIWNKDAHHTETTERTVDGTRNRDIQTLDRQTAATGVRARDTNFTHAYDGGDVNITFNANQATNQAIPYQMKKQFTAGQTPSFEPLTQVPNGVEQDITNNPDYTVKIQVTNENHETVEVEKTVTPLTETTPEDTNPSNSQLAWTGSDLSDRYTNSQGITQLDRATGESEANQDKEFITHSYTEYGNIGVTTTQQMLQAQRDLAMFNIFDLITKDFIKQFCIMVY